MNKYFVIVLFMIVFIAGCNSQDLPKPSMKELYFETFSIELQEHQIVYENGDIQVYKTVTNTSGDSLFSYENVDFNVKGNSFYDLGYFGYDGEEVLSIEDMNVKYAILYELVINVFLQEDIVTYNFDLENSRCVYTKPTGDNPDMWSNSDAIIRIYYFDYFITEEYEFSKEEEYIMSLGDNDTICHHDLHDSGFPSSDDYFMKIDIDGYNRTIDKEEITGFIKKMIDNEFLLNPTQTLIDSGLLYSPDFTHLGTVSGYDIVHENSAYNQDTKFSSYHIDDTYAIMTNTICLDSEQIYSCNGLQAYKNGERFYLIDLIDGFTSDEYLKFLDIIHAYRYQ